MDPKALEPAATRWRFKPADAIQGVLIALALLAMANCLKVVIHQAAWGLLTFEVVKDLSVIVGIWYLYRKSRESSDAVTYLRLLMAASFIADWAVVLGPTSKWVHHGQQMSHYQRILITILSSYGECCPADVI